MNLDRAVIGWDVGGAHLKACLQRRGEVLDIAQWVCPLWQGLEHLTAALAQARERWSGVGPAQHAVTMTGEMVDLFADREHGVRRIAAELQLALAGATAGPVMFFAGDAGWCEAADAGANWQAIASANWLATARHAALCCGDGVLVDVGSTTTDLIAFRDGRVTTRNRSDAQRLAGDELVYHGVVRTPLCALARRIAWRGAPHHVINEFFATTADVYRLTGELDPAHDLQTSADGAPKDLDSTRRRLARMVGLDRRDGSADDWLAFAHAWRAAQVAAIGEPLRRVLAQQDPRRDSVVVSAGCGDFLVADLLAHACDSGDTVDSDPARSAPPRAVAYGGAVARIAADAIGGRGHVQRWAQVCAPSVAVAALFQREQR